MPSDDPTIERLEDQIAWYDRESGRNKRGYKTFKTIELAAAASVPFCAGFGASAWATGGLSVLVVVLEGILHLNQFHTQWQSFRSTCESLKHEEYLHVSKAAHYSDANDPYALPSCVARLGTG
jgi:hypothetical protein